MVGSVMKFKHKYPHFADGKLLLNDWTKVSWLVN